jgi:zinc transport system substrate-binding protein
VDVEVLVAPGQSPHSYEPTPRQAAAIAQAKVYFRIGVPFEDVLVPKIQQPNPNLQVVDLREGITLRELTESEALEAHENVHGEPGARAEAQRVHEHEHAAGAPDPHTWLDPKNARIQARTICAALCRVDPARAAEFRQNLAELESNLDQLDRKIADALAPLKSREFFVFHPAFGYFADAYGLRQVPVEIEGKEPDMKSIRELIRRAKQSGVRVIFVQPQFSARAAEMVAREIGGTVVPLDDLAYDYIRNLESMARKVQSALAEHPTP